MARSFLQRSLEAQAFQGTFTSFLKEEQMNMTLPGAHGNRGRPSFNGFNAVNGGNGVNRGFNQANSLNVKGVYNKV
ncbi:MAG: hypothetical protein WC619_00775 [Patescibacteria group bacterium]